MGDGLVDIPTFGDCIEIAGLETFPVSGVATICNAVAQALAANVSPTQAERMTIHRFGSQEVINGAAVALPHGEAVVCNEGAQIQPSRLEQFALAVRKTVGSVWRAALDQVVAWLEPRPLLASAAVVCNRGCSSPTTYESNFQPALPTWMGYHSDNPGGDLGTHNSGETVTGKIQAWDSGEFEGETTIVPEAVANVRLTVTVTGGDGSLVDGSNLVTSMTIFTNSQGVGTFTLNVGPGSNEVEITGIGVGTTGVFSPSMNDPNPDPDPVPLEVGTLTFTADGLVPLYFDPDPPYESFIYTDANGVAHLDPFYVCSAVDGTVITSIEFIKNNGDPVDVVGLPVFSTGAVVTDEPQSDGSFCRTFSNITIDKTGAYRLVANGTFTSQKINVKPGK